jgi:lysozyme
MTALVYRVGETKASLPKAENMPIHAPPMRQYGRLTMPSSNDRILGIDVSHYQGVVNWHAVADSDVKFAIAKATEGTAVDEQFKNNWQGIQEAGLYRGAYHFARPGSDPEAQATYFAATIGPLGFRDLPPALDLEVADGHAAADVLAWAQKFVARAEALFARPIMIYSGQFWRGPLGNPSSDALFSERALWLAGYVPEPKLDLPKTWSKWTFWQYSDGSLNAPVKVPGVARCDQSWFDGDDSALNQLCAGASPEPPPAPVLGPNNALPPGTYFVWPRAPAVAGPSVKAWQARMVQLGYGIDADGVYGPQSKTACMALQRSAGLVPDGIVGPATWNATFASTVS